jgi:predicted Rossmann-fold nucleotide-binding protein
MGREVVNIRSSDVVIIIGGRSGTLGEFSIAYDEGKLIGILIGTGGITSEIKHIGGLVNKWVNSHQAAFLSAAITDGI